MSKITEQELEALADAFYKSQTGYERQNSTFEEAWLRLVRKCVEKAGIKIKDEEVNDDEKYETYRDGTFLNYTYWRLMEAMEYPGIETGQVEVDLYEVLEDALHMIGLGFKYLNEGHDF